MNRNASWMCGTLPLLPFFTLGFVHAIGPGWFDTSTPPVDTPGPPIDAAVGDLDGDGVPDLAVVCDGVSQVSLWRGLGDGRFASLPALRNTAPLRQVLLADFNGDGRAEVVAGEGDIYGPSGGVRVWRSTPTGFSRADAYAIPGNANYLACTDFDGDGRRDLAVAGHLAGSALVQVFHARTNGTFELIDTVGLGTFGGNGSELLAGDFDGDGAADLALTISGLCLDVVYGFGDGHFTPPVCTSTTFWQYELQASADLDLDGFDDIVFEELDPVGGRLHAMYGRPDRTFDFDGSYFADLYDVNGVAIADINGNGKPDVVAIDQRALEVLTGDGHRGFDPPRSTATGGKDEGKPIVADLDLDGRPDVVLPSRFAQQIAVFMHQ
jgi:hypothetical protein